LVGEPLLELAGVGHTYPGPPPVDALRDVDLRVYGGEMLAVVGPSGSGKSTLLNILGVLDEPTTGVRLVAGTDTTGMTDRRRTVLRARHLGFVFQAFHLVPHLTSMQNVALPLVHLGVPRGERRDRATQALSSVGLSHRLDAYPRSLSGGEQQRVAIARAVVHSPTVVLCDEPTGNLDSANATAILDLLRRLVDPDRTVVVVTHERLVRDRADRAIEVVDGRVH
jgi:putative ABC transport system ATP-binding protein